MSEIDEKTIAKNEKLEKYAKQIQDYDNEVVEWLIHVYCEYGHYMNVIIRNMLRYEKYYLLYDSDSEFRSLSYDYYSKLIKKYPFLSSYTDMLFKFIKEHHRIITNKEFNEPILSISDELREWLINTKEKHHVNMYEYALNWAYNYWNDNSNWPTSHKIKTKNGRDDWYEYNYKNLNNFLGIDELYRNMPKKSFTRGKKQEIELLMMYYYLNDIDTDEDFLKEYIEKYLSKK